MVKLISQNDLHSENIPDEIFESVFETIKILDSNYGTDRTEADLGGYILIVENSEDAIKTSDILRESINTAIPEISQKISNNFFRAVYILNPDFSVIVFYNVENAPDIVKNGANEI